MVYTGSVAYSNARFGQGTGPIVLNNLVCGGSEPRLLNCLNNGLGNVGTCTHGDDVGVECQEGRYLALQKQLYTHDCMLYACIFTSTSCNGIFIGYIFFVCFFRPSECDDGDIRLRDGTNEYEGRVEICMGRVWGTVCDDFWGTADAAVACRQLGYSEHS